MRFRTVSRSSLTAVRGGLCRALAAPLQLVLAVDAALNPPAREPIGCSLTFSRGVDVRRKGRKGKVRTSVRRYG